MNADIAKMNKVGGIYAILCENKIYIGQTSDILNRRSGHRSTLIKGTHKNRYLQRAWNKYGEDCFDFEVIEVCDEDVRDSREIFWITFFKSKDPRFGYNLESGGLANKHHSELTRAIMSAKAKGRKMSLETREKMSRSMLGKKRSKDFGEKMSRILKGIPKGPMSDERKKALSEATRGKKKSKETIARMVASFTPERRLFLSALAKRIWTGRKHSEATKLKMSIAKKLPPKHGVCVNGINQEDSQCKA